MEYYKIIFSHDNGTSPLCTKDGRMILFTNRDTASEALAQYAFLGKCRVHSEEKKESELSLEEEGGKHRLCEVSPEYWKEAAKILEPKMDEIRLSSEE